MDFVIFLVIGMGGFVLFVCGITADERDKREGDPTLNVAMGILMMLVGFGLFYSLCTAPPP
jgi:hypothetical protein